MQDQRYDGLHYEIFQPVALKPGSNPVVFVHGFPFSSAMWAAQVQAVVAAGLVAMIYDLRGLGQSDVGDGQYTIESHVDDLSALLDHVGFETITAIGLSMGGYILLRALERYPGRFKAAVLCDTKTESDPSEVRIKRAENIKLVKQNGPASFAESFVPGVFAPRSLEIHAAKVDAIRTVISNQAAAGIAGNLLALASRPDTTALLPRVNVPVLLLCGELDKTTPPSGMEAMQHALRRSTLHVLPNAAHMSNLENEDEFNAKLLTFLGGL